MLIEKMCAYGWANVYIAGDFAFIKAACRKFCAIGLCVTVTKTSFVYTEGSEDGAIIGLINYGRFPKEQEELDSVAVNLARFLIGECFQRSASVLSPTGSRWITKESQLQGNSPTVRCGCTD